ncbi:TPA: hypothetical protein DEA21_04045 [Candidatus Uhrbacteria bacterium]|nr:hypothetical protein [Candidatus Uhrbacteria bacterium]HCU31852.1 hypothetical protein [Candidatus Uhrbacteria bacterium]
MENSRWRRCRKLDDFRKGGEPASGRVVFGHQTGAPWISRRTQLRKQRMDKSYDQLLLPGEIEPDRFSDFVLLIPEGARAEDRNGPNRRLATAETAVMNESESRERHGCSLP